MSIASIPLPPFDRDTVEDMIRNQGTWAVVCFAVHMLFGLISKSTIYGMGGLPRSTRWQWYNRGVSTFHATIMFTGAVYYWVFINTTWEIQPRTRFEEVMIDMMLGYLWYDCVIELIHTRQMDTLAHHIMGLVSHIYTRLHHSDAGMFYSMFVYLAEASTPFLNISWLLHTLSHKDTAAFSVFAGILIFNFFVFRVLLSPVFLYHLIMHKEAFEGVEHLYYGNIGITALFLILNYVWFYKLIRVAFGKSTKKSRKAIVEKLN